MFGQKRRDIVRQALVASALSRCVEDDPLAARDTNSDGAAITLRLCAGLGSEFHDSFLPATRCCIRDLVSPRVSLRWRIPNAVIGAEGAISSDCVTQVELNSWSLLRKSPPRARAHAHRQGAGFNGNERNKGICAQFRGCFTTILEGLEILENSCSPAGCGRGATERVGEEGLVPLLHAPARVAGEPSLAPL